MKAVQSYYMEFGTYPRGAYSISEYVSVNACRVPDPSRCKNISTSQMFCWYKYYPSKYLIGSDEWFEANSFH